jgi:squalene synthase HpnD
MRDRPIVASGVPHGADAESTEADSVEVERIVRRSGTSFFWAMRLLPELKRRAMFAVYAFCREVDDIADDGDSLTAKRGGLADWRDEVDHLFAGRPRRAISRELLPFLTTFDLQKQDFIAIIDGMEMDAADRLRIVDMQELELYCDRVACAVGRLSVRVFGVPQPDGDRLAKAQGEALQLTNILRDLKEDARRDRLYLPADLLRAAGVPTADPQAALADARIVPVCERLAELAKRRFVEAGALVAACDRRQVRPAVIMMEVYRRTLQRLIRRGWERRSEPVSVPSMEKLWVALRYGVF